MTHPLDKPLPRKLQKIFGANQTDPQILKAFNSAIKKWQFLRQAKHWGPWLYRRNRTFFLGVLEQYVHPFYLRGCNLEVLEAWLQELMQHGDSSLHVRVYEAWLGERFRSFRWGSSKKAVERWSQDVLSQLTKAPDASARRRMWEFFAISWLSVPDKLAIDIYQIDSQLALELVSKCIEDRLLWEEHPDGYEGLLSAMKAAGDEQYQQLYRRVVSAKAWHGDALAWAEEISNPTLLRDQLEKHHPTQPAWSFAAAGATYLTLLKQRGADVLPYVERHLPDFPDGWRMDKSWKALAEYALEQRQWRLWQGVIHFHCDYEYFQNRILFLTRASQLSEAERRQFLEGMAGARYRTEWRSGPLPLDPKSGLSLYRAFPELFKSRFGPHLIISPQDSWEEVLQLGEQRGDGDVVDLLAGAHLARPPWGRHKPSLALVPYYRALRAEETGDYARRAARILAALKPFAFVATRGHLRENPLAALLFEPLTGWLEQPHLIRDLLESRNDYVREVALKLLVFDDDRATAVARASLDHLLAALLSTVSRRQRLPVFQALERAAGNDAQTARIVTTHMRQALELEDRHYPKSELAAALGRVLHRWPELRRASEQPLVYRRASNPESVP